MVQISRQWVTIRLPELDQGQGGEYRKATSVSRTLPVSHSLQVEDITYFEEFLDWRDAVDKPILAC